MKCDSPMLTPPCPHRPPPFYRHTLLIWIVPRATVDARKTLRLIKRRERLEQPLSRQRESLHDSLVVVLLPLEAVVMVVEVLVEVLVMQ